jgi:hypothetical protein
MEKLIKKTRANSASVQVAASILGYESSVMSQVTRRASREFSEHAVCDAGQDDAKAATAVALVSLRLSNIKVFLRSIAQSPRPK